MTELQQRGAATGDARHTAANASAGAGIVLAGLRKTFASPAGRVRAVDGVDIAIQPGETVALLGPNGAGKSTTIDMLLGLTKPDAGTVSLFGMPVREAVAAGRVGGMLQVGGLIHYVSVRELLTMMARLYPRPLPVDEIVELTGIGDIVDRRTTKLSGGQTQRVRAAIALISNPDLLVLDEPTVALDVEARREFWATMRGFAQRGKTILFATHYLEEADAFADRIILMSHGMVVADGPATAIKATVGLRTIRATLPDVASATLGQLPGVASVARQGDAIVLTCTDSDAALRALLSGYPDARDLEVTGAGLEAAFLQLTGDSGDARSDAGEAS